MLKMLLYKLALHNPQYDFLYRRFGHPGGLEWAELIRKRGDFYAMGQECYIEPYANVEDRPYVRLGNNVRLACCTILGHDGTVNMINRAYGLRLDSVGKVDIRDNVYIGLNAIILPGVTIGPNAIVSAGSVVRSDVKEGYIVSGVPAKPVGLLEMTVSMLIAKNKNFPWKHIVEQRNSEYDPSVEDELIKMRVKHFYENC